MFFELFSQGFFSNEPVRNALITGGGAAVVCAVTGVFALIRGHAFAGHALSDISSAGGAASFVLGTNPLAGFLFMALAGAAGIGLTTRRHHGEQGLSSAIILSAGLGCSALFLYFAVSRHNSAGATLSVMFGSLWTLPASLIPWVLMSGISALLLMAVIWRPLLLSTIDPELALLRGVPVRLTGILQLAALAMAVALSAMTVGAILSTALLTGPAAIALRHAKSPLMAVAIAIAIGLLTVWAGIWMAWESYFLTSARGWPVSFFIVLLIFILWVFSGACLKGLILLKNKRGSRDYV